MTNTEMAHMVAFAVDPFQMPAFLLQISGFFFFRSPPHAARLGAPYMGTLPNPTPRGTPHTVTWFTAQPLKFSVQKMCGTWPFSARFLGGVTIKGNFITIYGNRPR